MALTATDLEVFDLAVDNGSVFTSYYLNGFEFQRWQLYLHHAAQPNVSVIGGVGSGKTLGVGISAATWTAMLEHFHFMNVAPTSWQSTLMYDAILQWAEAGTYADKFITRVARKPYPIIELYNGSTMRFMTAQDDISRLRGWEGDWMNGDEFGFIDTLTTTCAIMRTRLRGKTPYGRARLGRLSVATTATDNPDLWDRFDRAAENMKRYLSFTVRTDQNPHLTTRDIELMMEDIPEELRTIEMDGARPMGRGEYFPLHVVRSCESRDLNELAYQAMLAETPGALYEETSRLGVLRYSLPYIPGHEYLIVGDPGTGNVPRRNAGVIMVFDITGFPFQEGSVAKMAAFAWVSGQGKYHNFEQQYKTWWQYYNCSLNAALETTGPQKSLGEYAFTLGLGGEQMLVEQMDMSGNKKNEALQAAIQIYQRGLFQTPFIRGMRNQLVGYTLPDNKLAQDIVSALMVAAAWLRRWRIWNLFDQAAAEAQSAEHLADGWEDAGDDQVIARPRIDSRPRR